MSPMMRKGSSAHKFLRGFRCRMIMARLQV